MRTLFCITIILCLFTGNVFADNTWEYNPRNTTAHLETTHIRFTTGDSTQAGPELYADETYQTFFRLITNLITQATADNHSIVLPYESFTSQKNGTCNRIIPES